MDDINRVIEQNSKQYLEDLFVLLRQPSISAQDTGVRECAELLAGMMRKTGIKTTIYETQRHPVVYGEIGAERPTRTILVYGHYDVQPPEPLEKWLSPPFEPTIRDGKIYGRGTSDNKAQLFAHVKGIEAYLTARSSLPEGLKVKYLFEGEEEIGSPNLNLFAEKHSEMLSADAAIFSDSHLHESGRPTVMLGLKGMLYVELSVKTLNRDMHSMKAASLPSPVWRLVTLLSHIKDETGFVRIPGFYDSVRPALDEEIDAVSRIPYDKQAILREHGAKTLLQNRVTDNYYYNMVFEPTANIAGIWAGYTGKGTKTVLPQEASVKIDFRLVPDQQPEQVLEKLQQHMNSLGYDDVCVEVHGQIRPSRTPIDDPWVKMALRAVKQAYAEEPVVFPGIGGSGPNYVFTDTLGMPCIVIPFAAYDQANHAPNENMIVEGYYAGIRTAAAIIEEAGKRV